MKPIKNFDLLIVGGGTAGMTAAIYAAKANIRAAIVESNICGGLVNTTYIVENFPSRKSIHGMDLVQKIQEQTELLGVTVDEAAEVTRLNLTDGMKEIETDEFLYRAPALVLATGRQPVPLEIDTHDCQEIHFCAICDGSIYKGKKVLVVGGGNSGFDEAYYLHSLGVKQIFLIEKMDRFSALQSAQDKLLRCEGVTAMTSTIVEEIICEEKLRSVLLKNIATGETQNISVDGVFVYMGQLPSNKLFADVVTLDADGYVITGEEMETNISGVFAAGDIRSKKYRQITTAIGDGTIAALSAGEFLRNKKL
ncbi:MAG: thioredoxin reductase [Phycisphaerae bacterium SM23_30]|nr:MAG: thioredoxin reductase [Phycisphaerae bacterium SM23_30]